MKLETLYLQYRHKFISKNILKIKNKHLSKLSKSYFYIAVFYLVFSTILFGMQDDVLFTNNKLMIIGNSIILGLIGLFFFKRYDDDSKEFYLKNNSLNNENKDLDFLYQEYYNEIKNDSNFTENIKELIEFSNLEIIAESKKYLNNPLVTISISVIIAIIIKGFIPSAQQAPNNAIFLANIIITGILILSLIRLFYYARNDKISPNIRFKYFLLNANFDIKHNKTERL